jgi:hypothetical protein
LRLSCLPELASFAPSVILVRISTTDFNPLETDIPLVSIQQIETANHHFLMASVAANAAKSASNTAGKAAGRAAAKSYPQDRTLQKGAKRDPELYVCCCPPVSTFPVFDKTILLQILLGIMSGAFGLAGYYFGRKPTSATSEAEISVADSSMPWQIDDHDHEDDSKHFKYRYHPRGDKNQTPRNAPSALNTVIIPNVTLPKVG